MAVEYHPVVIIITFRKICNQVIVLMIHVRRLNFVNFVNLLTISPATANFKLPVESSLETSAINITRGDSARQNSISGVKYTDSVEEHVMT